MRIISREWDEAAAERRKNGSPGAAEERYSYLFKENKQILILKINPLFLQHPQIFLPEGNLSVMIFLPLNMPDYTLSL